MLKVARECGVGTVQRISQEMKSPFSPDVRFTPESGHSSRRSNVSAL
jgi:hypothetical protein